MEYLLSPYPLMGILGKRKVSLRYTSHKFEALSDQYFVKLRGG